MGNTPTQLTMCEGRDLSTHALLLCYTGRTRGGKGRGGEGREGREGRGSQSDKSG